jgi:CheY-like chemotaxis protein
MNRTVLIVEDDIDMQAYFGIVLAGLGLNLVTAGNGAEAISILDSGRNVDLIILDMVMPVMNGEEFFRILRRERRLDIPVIFSSVDETRAKPLELIGRLDGIYIKGRRSQDLKELIFRNLGQYS